MYILKFVNSFILTTSRIIYKDCLQKSNFSSLFSTPRMPKKSKKAHKNVNTVQRNGSVSAVSIDVIGSGADGVPGCVLLNTCYHSYLINCGEGTMKLANEYKIKIHKSLNVFITYASWNNISGLMGYALAVQEANGRQFLIHGDSDIGSMFSVGNKFVNLKRLQVCVQSCSHNSEFSDGIISAKYVFLYPSIERNILDSSVSVNNDNENLSIKSEASPNFSYMKTKGEKNFHNIKQKNQNQVESLQNNKKATQYAISYIFKTKSSLGPLNFHKCLEYGVPPGPLLGQLKNGNDVTLENGNVVRSKDVKDPDIPGVNIIALQCPTEDYVDCLLEEPAFHEFQSLKNPAEAVVHFTSSKVVENMKYQEWISRFPKTTLHLFINEDNKRTGSVAIHRQQYKLNLLQQDLFPLLNDPGIPDFPRTENSDTQNGHTQVTNDFEPSVRPPIYKDKIYLKCNDNPFINGETLCYIPLKPKLNFDYSRSLVLKKEVFLEEIFESDEIRVKIEESKNAIKAIEKKIASDNRIYPKLVFLGTGSSRPSKVRNASGILVWLSSSKCILLDCGEYTYGQLVNFYGKQKTREVLRCLEAVFISHMHLDHHLGLITILKERKNAFDELNELPPQKSNAEATRALMSNKFSPVYVLAPSQMQNWLNWFSEKFEDISKLNKMIPNSHLVMKNFKSSENVDICKKNMELKSIMTVPVPHCFGSFGISIVHKEGWKITYSGDTKPCQELIELGMKSDILIHEATLEDAYIIEARAKHHSTTSQAIDVGKAMRAKYIILTHFSQRYCHLPNIDSSFSNLNIGIAFDFMEVPFNKLPLLPALIQPLQYTLSKYDEINKCATQSLLLKRDKIDVHFSLKDDLSNLSGTPAKVSKIN